MPAVVVVEADDVTDPEVVAAIEDLREQALATGLMNDPVDVSVNPDGTVAVITIPMEGNGTDDARSRRCETLREDVIPAHARRGRRRRAPT